MSEGECDGSDGDQLQCLSQSSPGFAARDNDGTERESSHPIVAQRSGAAARVRAAEVKRHRSGSVTCCILSVIAAVCEDSEYIHRVEWIRENKTFRLNGTQIRRQSVRAATECD